MTSKTRINQLRWLAATIMLVAAMVMPSTAWAQTMYTVFDTETSTLTFKYDNSKPESTDTQKVYDVPLNSSQPGWITNHASAIEKVVFDESFAAARPTICYQWFFGCSALTDIQGIKNLNTSEVYDMRSMFGSCSSLTTLDLSGFDTQKVNFMDYMFSECGNLVTIYVSDNFSTAKVSQSTSMFYNCYSIIGAIKYDSNKTDATYANYTDGYFTKEGTVAHPKDSYVIYTDADKTLTFKYGEIPSSEDGVYVYDVPKYSSSPEWISNHASSITKVVFDASFADARPTTCYSWFFDCSTLTEIQGIQYLNTSKVNDMTFMFVNCSSLTKLDLSGFDTQSVSSMAYVFLNCSKLVSIFVSDSFKTTSVIRSVGMFDGCDSLVGAVAYDSNKTDANMANYETGYFMNIDYGTPMVIYDSSDNSLTFKCGRLATETGENQELYYLNAGSNTPGWLSKNSSITKVVFDKTFANARPGTCYCWFDSFESLTEIQGIENLNTLGVTNMTHMFWDCKSLTSLDLSSFNTANVNEMDCMFGWCTQLTTIYVSEQFNTEKVSSSVNMFLNTSQLRGAIAYYYNKTDVSYANYATGYFTCAIKTAADLASFAGCVNTTGNGGAAAVLFNDITMTAEDTPTPIGSNGYTGTFDGLGHTISGLNFNETNNCLFANNGGTIKNLGVVNATIADGSKGSICQTNSGTMEKCFFMGTTDGTTTPNGAICQTNSGTITNCYYLADSETDEIEGTTAMTAAQFKSGAVAWLLNGLSPDGEWGQLLGTEDYPVWGGVKVYQCSPCTGVYSNEENELTADHNVLYDNGFGTCSACGIKSYQSATQNASGEYEIGNAGQLCWFAGLVNGTLTDGTQQNLTAKGVLTGNIDLASISNWTPIGNESNKFGGTFDGKNFKVQHLSITQQGYNTGLFGFAYDATMQNISIDGNITLNTTTYTEGYGSIAGCVVNSTISNCHSSVNFTINTEMDASNNCIGHIGGIVGKMDESKSTDSNVSGCSYSGTMNLGNNKVNVAAGIVGYAIWSDVPITNCSFTGTIKSECNDAIVIGGIFGYTRSEGNVKVTNCLQAGTLEKTGNSSLTGMLIGQINTGYGANAVINNYYTSSTFNVIGTTTGTPTTTPATQCSTEQLQSGEICYLLNGSSSDGGWGQQLGEDKYPVPGSPYKLMTTAKKTEDNTYWATFSDQTSDFTLSVPSTRTLKVYNATVSGGTLTLSTRTDCQVAKGEGVLLKTDGKYVNVKANESDGLDKVDYSYNNLVATPATAQTVTADNGYTLYRLTYNNVSSQEKLGFYLSLVKDSNGKVDQSSVGKKLKATPGKAYLKVQTSEATEPTNAKLASAFAFPGDDGGTTDIECITVTDENSHINGNANGIYDLQGRKVSKPAKGVYIKNNKKVVFKLKN